MSSVSVPEPGARLLRALSDPALFLSARGQVLAANDPARRALPEMPGQGTDCQLSAFVEDSPESLAATLRTWSRSTEPTPGSFTARTARGPTVFNGKGSVIFLRSETSPSILLVRFWPRADANPFVLLNQKITELNDEVARRIHVEEALRRSELALRERAMEAEALNRAKDEFLATVSHELRTPLNAILGWSSLLLGRGRDSSMQKGLDIMHRNARSQARLIDDILDVSRIITGKLLLETRPFDLLAITEEAVEVVRPSAAAKGIELVLPKAREACLLIADPDRLRQVIWNLLSNAVKFTERGGNVCVEVQRKGSQCVVTVTDTGRGVDPTFLPFVFDRFKQADSSTTRRVGGLGLGLALVRHITELHGGSVQAFSEGLGKGATFTITLPVRAVLPEAAAPEAGALEATASGRGAAVPEGRPDDARVSLRDVRILVVDDEPDACELLALVLTQAGAQVATAESVSSALDALSRFRPHVLVSDIGMPEEDGYSLMRRLRRLERHEGGAMPAVAVTAYTRAEDRAKALAAGFTAHIGKPVNPADLVAAVANLVPSSGG